MDFHRMAPTQPQVPRTPVAPDTVMQVKAPEKRGWATKKHDILTLGGHLGTNLLLFVVALLIAAVAWLTYSANPPTAEHSYVNAGKLQAVFLNTGQVYFGNVQAMNKDYLALNNVFYLQSASTTSNASAKSSSSSQNLSLIKLGCELHAPYDQMIINTSEITFWENIQAKGQVAKAVAKYKQENPKGQDCSTQQTQGSTSLQNQSATTNNTTATTNQ
jgi:hypothetical protein